MSRYFVPTEDSKPAPEATDTKVFVIDRKTIGKSKAHQHIRLQKKRKRLEGKRKSAVDQFPGRAPVSADALARHDRGPGINTGQVRTKFRQKEAERREKAKAFTAEIAARAELLLDEEAGGFLEGDVTDEFTGQVRQVQIRKAVDAESASKGFDLNLPQFGPYTIDYTRNGRFLLMGGRRGHVAALDWISKDLKCEINVQESVHDVKWLHTENMFAVAQKKWTYIYDNQGIEIHCLKKLDNIVKLEFLPYHFLLAASSDRGFLSWVDISVGKMVAQFNTRLGPLGVMCQNPANAVLCLGHSNGVVSMWTPNMKEPVAKILSHRQAVRAVAVDSSGNYLATSAADRSLKIWDVRQFSCVQDYKLGAGASQLRFSGREMLAAAADNEVHVFRDCCTKSVQYPYMTHRVFKHITDIQFVPFEDVLGIGHSAGFSSMLVPGSGEANYDALEANPYQTKKQRQEAEVKALLEKVQPELITLDPSRIGDVDVPTCQEQVEERNKKIFIKPQKIDFEPRNKTKGKGGTAKKYHVKRTHVEEEKLRDLRGRINEASEEPRLGKKKRVKEPKGLLDRLK